MQSDDWALRITKAASDVGRAVPKMVCPVTLQAVSNTPAIALHINPLFPATQVVMLDSAVFPSHQV